MARLIRRLDQLEESPEAYISERAMEHLSLEELHAIIAYGRRAIAAAEAGLDRELPTEEEAEALAHHEAVCLDLREGLLW